MAPSISADEIGKAFAVEHRLHPPRHLGFVRRLKFERRRAVLDGMRIDAGDGRDIGRVAGRMDEGHAPRKC